MKKLIRSVLTLFILFLFFSFWRASSLRGKNASFDAECLINQDCLLSLQMTVEPPPGIKANLLRSLGGVGGVVTDAVWEDSGPGPAWKRLLFGLCFFNAVVHERKKFGAVGWNIPYEFTASDLEVCIQPCPTPSIHFGARSKGFSTLSNVSKLQFFAKIGNAKVVCL